MNPSTRRIGLIALVPIFLIAFGTVGYMILADLPVIDALYMTFITVSTVGFREVTDLDAGAKIFTIGLIIAGIGTVAYTLTSVAAFLLEGEFSKILRRRRMEKQIARLRNHYIICGAGQTGQVVIEQFRKRELAFAVIDEDAHVVEELQKDGTLAVVGDATHEEDLESIGIRHAKALIATLSTDAENVFTVLTARELNPDLHIVARAFDRATHSKLRKAGANNTISPNELGGARMAALILKPAVIAFIDVITRAGETDLELEEVRICPGSHMVGQTLKDVRIPEKTSCLVLAIQEDGSETLRFNPSFQETLSEGDTMLVLGQAKQINRLRELACEPLLNLNDD